MSQLTPVSAATASATRFALVIGNSNYGDGTIVSGIDDAKAMAQALGDLDFAVTPVTDGSLHATKVALDTFKASLAKATAVVVFYSGHGFQVNGQSFLQPIDGSIDPASTLPLAKLLQALGAAPNEAVKLVFLDVCRLSKKLSAQLPPGATEGLAPPEAAPNNVVQSFAASPGQTAASGNVGALSPYTTVLVRHIREAGLTVEDLLGKVSKELVSPDEVQTPTQDGMPPQGFCLRPAVAVAAEVTSVDDGLVVVLNGQVVMNQTVKSNQSQSLTLQAGPNSLTLLVFNQRSFHNTQSWERTEGWNYTLLLRGPDGKELTGKGCLQSPCFKDSEDVPFKNGPHNGGTFKVASANLFVDPMTGALEMRDVDTKVWEREAPVWARDQDVLYEAKVSSLPLDKLQVGGMVSVSSLEHLLEGLKGGPFKVPNFDDLFVTVRGNRAYKEFVRFCMVDRQADRIADLNKSLAAALTGDHTPMQSFDDSLTACVRARAAQAGAGVRPEDIAVWTALEDRSS
jgi:hypothetical protein